MPAPRARLLLACLALLAAAPASATVQVAVSLLPQAFLVERVGGDRVATVVLVGPGDNEATYAPSPGKLAALESAVAWFTLGVPFEKAWLPRIVADRPDLAVVDLAEGLPRRRVEGGGHAHGEDDRQAGEPDPHTWTDPRLAARMAVTIGETLARLDPPNGEAYRANARALEADLLALHEELAARLAPVAGGVFIVFHPSWGYFADAYGLVQLPIETGGHEPGPRALATLIDRGRAAGARAVFVQPQFSGRSASAVAEALGARVIEADPLARDYIENLRALGDTVARALAPEPGR
jgi:zinc transport system substrate-binding protein